MNAVDVDEVRAWIAASWDLDLSLAEWWRRLAAAGLAFPHWPEGLGGRGWSPAESRVVARELGAAGAVAPPTGVGQAMGGPTVIAHGTEAQRQALVPGLASGEDGWCQLFSEPSSGSDLAGLQTTAVRDGDEWVVNGQKVWNSGAHNADRGLLLARTDPSVPKHQGISYFVIDMDQPGVDARPLRQMNGGADFDEVFLTDARVPADRLIGELGGGWHVAQTTLAHERANIGTRTAGGAVFPSGGRYGLLDERVGDLLARAAASTRGPISGFVIPPRVLVDLAREFGRHDDPVIRQRLVAFRAMADTNRWNGQRTRAAAAQGTKPGVDANLAKLNVANMARTSRDLALAIIGPYGMLAGDDAPHGGAVQTVALSSPAASLGGGTDEIQRNVIGERGLGLPREPQADKDVPFRDLPMGTRRERGAGDA
ncbi:MAG TPA: acyl-CoA dehydrogenase family protein [Acidimicrobiales bacterium]|nr:acyl-CoA dehydrogenase family protein [Acidimicrobiales bacterium]